MAEQVAKTRSRAVAKKAAVKKAATRKVTTKTQQTSSDGRYDMSEEHKAALAQGREEGAIVRRYLEALSAHAPKRGRKRSPESAAKRLKVVLEQIPTAEPLRRLHLVQERIDLQEEIARQGETVDLKDLEDAFVAAAAGYSQRKGISAKSWRDVGVPPAVLKRAGLK